MSDDCLFRPACRDDVPAAYAVFRRSIHGYLRRIGLAEPGELPESAIEAAWTRQSAWIEHLCDTAAENWVAVDGAGRVVGWALSIERAGHLELAFFFVDPSRTSRGIGAGLLERAFSRRSEGRRTIMATHEPAALSLYLRNGVRHLTTACDIGVRARPAPRPAGLALRPLAGDDDIAAVAAIEERLLHLRRETDIAFLARDRPGWLALRGGEPVGYAFAMNAARAAADCGPIGVLDAGDLPHLLDHVLAEAPEGAEVSFTVPMANPTALGHLLALGGRIDTFYVAVLSSEDDLSLDRYVHTSPSFII